MSYYNNLDSISLVQDELQIGPGTFYHLYLVYAWVFIVLSVLNTQDRLLLLWILQDESVECYKYVSV